MGNTKTNKKLKTPSTTTDDMVPHHPIVQETKFVIEKDASISIYDIYSNRRRLVILMTLAMASLQLPFSDTIYLPALSSIEHDLKANTTLVDYTVSIYFIMVGIFGLVWGPMSDRFGRKIMLIASFAIFLVFTIVCIFAQNITILLVFRALQGGAITGAFIIGQGAVADIYPPERRGFATGLFLVPFLVGPIIGPLIGGFLSNSYGWRSTFVLLAIMAVVFILLILILVPETHHYMVLERLTLLATTNGSDNKNVNVSRIREADTISKPHFMAPWRPLAFLVDMNFAPYVIASGANFGSMFALLTLMSNREAQAPYSLSQIFIGILYIPAGVATLIGSLLGGSIADWSARRYPHSPEGRLFLGAIGSFLCPIGLLIFGWTFHFELYLAEPLFGSALFGLGQAMFMPGLFSYASVKNSAAAGAAVALVNSLNCVSAGVAIIVAVPLVAAMKYGPLFSLLAGICLTGMIIVMSVIIHKLRTSALPQTLD